MTRIQPKDESDFFGILHSNRRIKPKCSSRTDIYTDSTYHNCEDALLQTFDEYYCSSRNEAYQWITFTFPKHFIAITNYTFSMPSRHNYGPINFTFEGFDGKAWHTLDDVIESGLRYQSQTMTRPVSTVGIFTSFRISKNCPTYEGEDKFELRVSNFDIFGAIVLKHNKTELCKRTRSANFLLFVVLLLVSN